jgi:hypothetical protein
VCRDHHAYCGRGIRSSAAVTNCHGDCNDPVTSTPQACRREVRRAFTVVFGLVVERQGRFKFVSYGNKL